MTDRQVAVLRQRRMEGKTQDTAAAMAVMSVRSARKWQSGPLPSETIQERRWRTRRDPFEGVWEEDIEPLLRGDPGASLKQRQLSSGWRSITPAGSAPPICVPYSDDYRTGERYMGRTGRSTFPRNIPGTGGPVRLHSLQLPGGDHRWPALSLPADPADIQPFGRALCRGGHR